tara:strand:+ start:65 stop:1351 length:1287 start_codon:yes stop_codon:yes gene_type:complete
MKKKIKLGDLIPDDVNANKGNPRGLAAVESSLQKYGAARSVVLDKDNRILAGNKTWEAAGAIGLENVQIVETTGDTLVAVKRLDISIDSPRGRALAIADNRAGEVGLTWDAENLAQLSTQVDLLEFWTPGELEALNLPDLSAEDPAGGNLGDPDEVPEAQEEPISRRGDLWILGEHRVLCGDSTNADDVARLMDGEKADMVFTDPPYGIKYQSNMKKYPHYARTAPSESFDILQNDDTLLDGWVGLAIEHCKGFIFSWCSWQVFSDWFQIWNSQSLVTNVIIWSKGGGGMGDIKKRFIEDYEIALVMNQGAHIPGHRYGSVWTIGKDDPSTYLHPTQKPVELAVFAMEAAGGAIAKTVLDLFLGSGSTLIAAEKTGRKCYGMELSPQYVDVIVRRWQEYTGKAAVHAHGAKFEQLAKQRLGSVIEGAI